MNEKLNKSKVIKIIKKKEYIVLLEGEYKYMINEMVEFKNGQKGIVLKSSPKNAQVAIISDNSEKKSAISIGQEVFLTNKAFDINCSQKLLGSIINVYGKEILRFNEKTKDKEEKEDKKESKQEIFKVAKMIYSRSKVDRTLFSGTSSIDWMIPIAKGQRELIIGDRKTGKTSLALNMIIAQKETDVKCIYVAIGQKHSELLEITKTIKENNMADKTLIVTSLADENATNKYLTPYIAISIAEYLQENYGEDILIIFDDLSKHANSYRELSLLLEISPTREAYPGDIFYVHSSLLERAGSFNNNFGGGSITAIPIAQTENENISAFITTNLISITDGQIFTSKDLFNSGQKPAINIPYSVSRVGSIAQSQVVKDYSQGLKLLLSRYEEVKKMQKMSSLLSEENKKIIQKGNRWNMLIKQENNEIMDYGVGALLLILSKKNYLNFLLSYEDLQKIKNTISNILNNTISGRKIKRELIKKQETNEKFINIFIELEIAPMIKHILLNNNYKLENEKEFNKIYGNIRNESRILMTIERQKNAIISKGDKNE